MNDHIGVPLYRKSANDPENDFHGRLSKEIARLRRIPPQPMFSDLHRSVLKSRPFNKSITDKHTDSLTGNNLNRYLKRAVDDPEWTGNIYDDPFFAALRPKPLLPEPYRSLIDLQSSSGLWADLEGVLKCLSMPTAYRMKNRAPWETATALALAFLRQSDAQLAPALAAYHDHAIDRVSKDLIFEAREAISTYRFETMDEKDMTLELELDDYLDRFYQEQEEKQRKQQLSEGQGQGQGQGLGIKMASAPGPESGLIEQRGDASSSSPKGRSEVGAGTRAVNAPRAKARPSLEEHPDWRAAYRQRFDVRVYGRTVTQEEDDKAFDLTVCQATRSVEINRSVFFGSDHDPEPTEEDLEKQDKVQELRRKKAFGSVSEKVDDTNDKLHQRVKQIPALLTERDVLLADIEERKGYLVECLAKTDEQLEAIKACLHRCSTEYRRSALMADRNTAFEELTAMLGDGFEPSGALNVAKWKSTGVPGHRPLCIAVLNAIRDLSLVYRKLDKVLRSLRDLRKTEQLILKTVMYKASMREKEKAESMRSSHHHSHHSSHSHGSHSSSHPHGSSHPSNHMSSPSLSTAQGSSLPPSGESSAVTSAAPSRRTSVVEVSERDDERDKEEGGEDNSRKAQKSGRGVGDGSVDGSERSVTTDDPRIARKGSKSVGTNKSQRQRQRWRDQGQGLEVRVLTQDSPLGASRSGHLSHGGGGGGGGAKSSNGIGGGGGGNVTKGVRGVSGMKNNAVDGVRKTSVRFAKNNQPNNHFLSPNSHSVHDANSSPGASPGASADATSDNNNNNNNSNDLMQATAPIGSLLGSKIGLSTFAIHFFWHGQDVLIKVLTSLDFLREDPYLRKWYDRGFPFLCNPLMLPFSLGHDNVLRSLGLQNRPLLQKVRFDWEGGGDLDEPAEAGPGLAIDEKEEALALVKGGTAGGGDYYDVVSRVDQFIDDPDPLKKRPFFLAFRTKWNKLSDAHRLSMWPGVPNFYGYDDSCIYPLWACYKALLVLTTQPAIHWIRRANEWENRLLRAEWCVTSMQDAIDHESQRQLDRLKPKPPPFSSQPIYRMRERYEREKQALREEYPAVPEDKVFTYVG